MAKRGTFEPLCKEFLDLFDLFDGDWKNVEHKVGTHCLGARRLGDRTRAHCGS